MVIHKDVTVLVAKVSKQMIHTVANSQKESRQLWRQVG